MKNVVKLESYSSHQIAFFDASIVNLFSIYGWALKVDARNVFLVHHIFCDREVDVSW